MDQAIDLGRHDYKHPGRAFTDGGESVGGARRHDVEFSSLQLESLVPVPNLQTAVKNIEAFIAKVMDVKRRLVARIGL